MRTRTFVHHLLSLLISASLLLTPAASTAQAAVPQAVSLRTLDPLPASPTVGEEQMAASVDMRATALQRPAPTGDLALYRTHIVIDSPTRRARLDALGVVVLEEGEDWAVVLADDEQLESLARLRYEPRASDEFVSLVDAHADASPWLAAGLSPLVTQAASLRGQNPIPASPASGEERMAARKNLRAAAHALTPEQRTALADLTSLDDDADGLTNVEESWWCTDVLNPNSDGDAKGYTDGQEVRALLDFSQPRTVRWGYGPPFGPPNAWPDFNDQDGNPSTPACNDGDFDTIPDRAEAYMVGTRVGTGDSENTDGDKFDDGQEFFGTTYCPGGVDSCGYGSYPRERDASQFVSPAMPEWIRPPGDSPFVAAYPVIDVQIDPATIRITTKEIKTFENTITEGTEISEGFAETKGNSTSVGTIDTNTRSGWQEHSTTEGGIEPASATRIDLPQFGSPIESSISSIPIFGGAVGINESPYTPDYICAIDNTVRVTATAGNEYSALCDSFISIVDTTPRRSKPATNDRILLSDQFSMLVTNIQLISDGGPAPQYAIIRWLPVWRTSQIPINTTVYPIVGHYSGDFWRWYVAGSNRYAEILQMIPDENKDSDLRLMPENIREHSPRSVSARTGGYYLPYSYTAGQIEVTQGELNPGYSHAGVYAYDFGFAGEVVAIADGRVIDIYEDSDISCNNGVCYQASNPVIVIPMPADCKSNCYNKKNFVTIQQDDGAVAHYWHLAVNSVHVNKNQRVQRGDPIGTSGRTGWSDGIHLHLQVERDGSTIPIGFVEIAQKDNSDGQPLAGNKYSSQNRIDNLRACYREPICKNSSPTLSCTAEPTTNDVNQPRKSTTFWQSIGRTISGWFGKLTGGSIRTTSAIAVIPGCGVNASCADQAVGRTNQPVNHSSFVSNSQCPGNGPYPGQSSYGVGGGGSGLGYIADGTGFTALRTWSETTTTGKGWSTSHSETRTETEYSEITRSTVNTLVSSEAWSTATTTDPTDAARLTFAYTLYNRGSDLAAQVTGLRINLLIGDLPPITWDAPDRTNLFPAQAKGPFSSGSIPLTLDQLAAIDNGAPIRVVVADYSYNDDLYDQNAWGRGVLFHVDDGTADGDEEFDTYLIVTGLEIGETYQETLARYFPTSTFVAGENDPRDGTLTNIRTPEFDQFGEISGWQDHPINDRAWWELAISNGGETDGVTRFQDMPAKPKTDVYLRYFVDTDGDGYTDRAERDAGTDATNPDSHPRPLLVVAEHTVITNTNAIVQISLQNLGNFDASSVEVWAIEPDDSITITDNLIGGGGRVRAGRRVVLGARISTPDLSNWVNATAKPYPGGQFQGNTAKTFYFRADTSGTIGNSGGLQISWSTDNAAWTPLDVGSDYTPWNSFVLTDGVEVSLSPGDIVAGETFQFATDIPIDTFSYTVNRTPYTPPMLIVSYNDAQGNHKFVTDVETAYIQEDLTRYYGDMRRGLQVDVVQDGPFQEGANRAFVVFKNPALIPVKDGKVYIEMALPDGTVAKEYVLDNQTFEPGPNVVEFNWNTADFSPAFDPAGDYHILAFVTDRRGTILENTVKDLDNLGKEKLPKAVFTDTTWDFGTAQQGTLIENDFVLASIGYQDLLAYLGTADGISIEGGSDTTLPRGDVALYTVQLNTESLPVGAYEATIPVRTSDPQNPSASLTIRGTITEMPGDAPGGAVLRPLDVNAAIPGDHAAGEWVEFTHSLGPDAANLHPVKVYSQDYGTLHGVGKYATDFGAGTASYDMFGTGRDGSLNVTANPTVVNLYASLHTNVSAGATSLAIGSNPGLQQGDEILIHQTQGTGAGNWEFNTITNQPATVLNLAKPLANSYVQGGSSRTQIIRVPHYSSVVVSNGGLLTASSWNGVTGGILVFRVSDTFTVESGGIIDLSTKGYRGTTHSAVYRNHTGIQGEGLSGTGSETTLRNGNGGGGGQGNQGGSGGAGGGGGGGNGTAGSNGQSNEQNRSGGEGGNSAGTTDALNFVLGGAGGEGGADEDGGNPGGGGNGGGIVMVHAKHISNLGQMLSHGGGGGSACPQCGGGSGSGMSGGGAGAGGSILIRGRNLEIGSNAIKANGGTGGIGPGSDGRNGGNGGVGRIRVEYCETLTGTTTPAASTQKLNCYIAEQAETAPYDTARLNLPETFSGGRTYKVQYGRRLSFPTPATQTTTIRLPKQLYSDATIDALVNNTGVASGPFALSVDFGNDGVADWTRNTTTTFPATLNVTGTVDALNAYLVSRTDKAWGAEVEVPVRVVSDRQADVLLTNLVLRLQVNQPTARAAEVEIAADRPLDWQVVVTGNYSQGAQYDFAHSLGPNAASLHPCTVYDQNGRVLKGVGKYCSDFGTGTVSHRNFGTGQNGDLIVNSGETFYPDDTRSRLTLTATSGQPSLKIHDAAVGGWAVGQEVLVIQMQGTDAGNYEFGTIASFDPSAYTVTLEDNLTHTYTVGGNSKAQVLRVMHYRNVTVHGGGVLAARAWDGSSGGVLVFRCSQSCTVNGHIDLSGKGFNGGDRENSGSPPAYAQQGDSPVRPGIRSTSSNGGGGGGALDNGGGFGAGGGGGGYATTGESGGSGSGGDIPGVGGTVYGQADLSVIYLGAGGGGGEGPGGNDAGGLGGDGGGSALIFGREVAIVGGSVTANGERGNTDGPSGGSRGSGGGGGSGGSILIQGQTVTLGANRVTATGGAGGGTCCYSRPGGAGGVGRIRIEYQTINSGWSTNPTASAERRQFYIIEQIEQSPYTTTRLYLPDAVSGSRSYLVQYARRFIFAASGQQTSSLRLARRVYGGASLDLLVSNAGAATGNLALCLDLGNDGVCDYTHSGSTNFPVTLEATGLAEALNNYLLSRSDIPWGDPVDVPVRLTLDRQADVMLTNLALTPLGAKTRFVRLEARTYSTATLSLEFRQPGVASGPLAFTVDVGADGSVDWSYAGTPSFPARLTSPNLAAALNNYLSPFQGGGGGGSVDVPIRIVPSPFLELSLTDFDADPADRPDLVPQAPTAGAARNGTPIVEGDTVPLTAVIQNNGTADSGPLAVTFYAIRNTQTFYIGADFIPNISSTGAEEASIPWNTLGFPGDTTVRAVVDPFNRTRESDESNNSAEALIPIRTRPDLHVTAIQLSNPLLMAGETVTVTLTLSNSGQTDAGAQSVALYNANPDSGGALVGTHGGAPLPGETATTVQFQWTPTAPGPYRLFSLSDKDGAVNESDEGNNRTWQDVYVGLAAPVLLDSGPGEPVYSPSTGYGVVDEGQPDVTSAPCGNGATVEETQRLDFDGRVVYRFDHLLPGRYYHLDVTLYECTGAGRQQSIYIDGNLVDGPVNLGDGEVHHRSILIDPALYADHSVEVSIESPGVNGAIVSAVNLHAVDYRYADSGGVNDPDYSAGLGYGALNGVKNSAWGRLPYQNVRVNQTGRSVDYRYDNLVADKFYQLHLSFFQTNDTSRVQQVEIDGKLAGAEIALVNNEKQRITLPVPTGTYTDDGSISVSVVRVNANVGAIVNEIALEEVTVPTAVCGVASTPYWTYAYGSVTIEGAPALPGTVVTAENENGDIVGCYRVEQSGFYSFMPIFGSLAPTPGMAEGEQVKFRVNGQLALTEPTLNWTNDKDIHQIDLTISGIESQWIRLNPGWTLFSLRVQPPVTSVTDVLKPVEDIYCDVHGERDVYNCDLPPQAQALTELHGGRAYYIRNNSSATANLFVQGAPIAPTTPISLHTDWNWVGYLLSESTPVGDALASIAGKYSRVADGKARLYKPDQPQFSTLTQMVPDDGYLLFMTEAATLVYPAPVAAAGGEPAAVREVCGDVSPTPAFTWIYGELLVNGQPAAVGSRVDVLTPRGELAGCFTVDSVGLYGFLPVYGADNGNPPLPGFSDGEAMTIRVNGQVVELAEPLLWRDDKQERQADLSATIELQRFFLPLIGASAQAEGAGADTQTPVYLPILGR